MMPGLILYRIVLACVCVIAAVSFLSFVYFAIVDRYMTAAASAIAYLVLAEIARILDETSHALIAEADE
jgi:hypothetical protein